MRRTHSTISFCLTKSHRIAEYLVSQGLATAGNLLYGLLCIRLLPIGEYAKFVVVFAIQGSLVVLMDIGISGCLTPLVGERIDDLQLIADYLASARQIARVLFVLVIPITIVAYPLLVHNRNWGWQVVAAMVVIVLVSAWFALVGAAYGAVLILRRDRMHWYRAQIISSYGTLALLGVFIAFHWLNAFAAILINVAGVIWVGGDYFFHARKLLGVAGKPTKEKRKAIIQLTVPLVPAGVFYALSGQISVLLITIFGRTAAVASVGALSRLGQIFTLLSPMNAILVGPYIAKLSKARLKMNYLLVVVIAVTCGGAAVALARAFPEIFLWVLGPKYAGLRVEVVLVVLSGAMALVGGVMVAMNSSRRFVYYWAVLSWMILTLAVEAIFIWKVDLSTVRAVLWFNVAVGVPSLLINVLVGVYGLSRGGRRIVGIDYSPERQ
jgi:O-antigen/teichoic acid export membrane protein